MIMKIRAKTDDIGYWEPPEFVALQFVGENATEVRSFCPAAELRFETIQGRVEMGFVIPGNSPEMFWHLRRGDWLAKAGDVYSVFTNGAVQQGFTVKPADPEVVAEPRDAIAEMMFELETRLRDLKVGIPTAEGDPHLMPVIKSRRRAMKLLRESVERLGDTMAEGDEGAIVDDLYSIILFAAKFRFGMKARRGDMTNWTESFVDYPIGGGK